MVFDLEPSKEVGENINSHCLGSIAMDYAATISAFEPVSEDQVTAICTKAQSGNSDIVEHSEDGIPISKSIASKLRKLNEEKFPVKLFEVLGVQLLTLYRTVERL